MSIPTVIGSTLDFHRSQLFPGATLKFFEMTPSGRTQILELVDGWGARKAQEKDMLAPSFWIIDILNPALTEPIRKKTATVTIGDREMKGHKFKDSFGKLGVCVLTGELL